MAPCSEQVEFPYAEVTQGVDTYESINTVVTCQFDPGADHGRRIPDCAFHLDPGEQIFIDPPRITNDAVAGDPVYKCIGLPEFPHCTFIGNINCHNIEIHGQFEGTLKASGLVAIFPPASVTGDIQSEQLVVYPGAILNINGHTTD